VRLLEPHSASSRSFTWANDNAYANALCTKCYAARSLLDAFDGGIVGDRCSQSTPSVKLDDGFEAQFTVYLHKSSISFIAERRDRKLRCANPQSSLDICAHRTIVLCGHLCAEVTESSYNYVASTAA
jgi:hypothetical protein